MSKISILIADDHLVVREGLMVMLESIADFEVIGQATDGEEAVKLAVKLQPDVALLDIQMPRLEGIEATRRIRKTAPGVNIVILTSYDQTDYIYKAIQAGAKGYILKDCELDELAHVVRAAAHGQSLLPPEIATRLVNRIAAPALQNPLTNREQTVLHLLAQGRRNIEIAAELKITERTVKNHVANIIAKMGVNNRTQAVSEAVKLGLIEL